MRSYLKTALDKEFPMNPPKRIAWVPFCTIVLLLSSRDLRSVRLPLPARNSMSRNWNNPSTAAGVLCIIKLPA